MRILERELSAYSADTDQTMCILGGGGHGTGGTMRILERELSAYSDNTDRIMRILRKLGTT
jgi:hypothetical protein